MINSVKVGGVASYELPPERMSELTKVNFLFGPNGAGKSTIAKVIVREDDFPTCSVTWKGGNQLQPLVYDRAFVRRNFDQGSELKGVFTLGEDLADTWRAIREKKRGVDELTSEIEMLRITLEGDDGEGGKVEELSEVEERIQEKCWDQKRKHDEAFSEAFTGYRHSVEAFTDKVLDERVTNSASASPLEELVEKAESVFGSDTTSESLLPSLAADQLLRFEKAAILQKKVIGRSDVDLAAMIERLENSDWVRQGRSYFEETEDVCPFCQQPTPSDFGKKLGEYFDKTFEEDNRAIQRLQTEYASIAEQVREEIESLLSEPSEYLDAEKLEDKAAILEARIVRNAEIIEQKKEEPSRSMSLETIGDAASDIQLLIDAANTRIKEHNKLLENLSKERAVLSAQIWNYLIEAELKSDLEVYERDKRDLTAAIESLEEKIRQAECERNKKKEEIRRLERETTSLEPTKDGINELLSSLGFEGFSLAMAESGEGYKLVRPDGSDARETLSEGERAFLTFLYFFHLLKGSASEDGVTTDRVVVFDDPVTSMDSNVLFVVASLIKSLIREVREGSGLVKQVFVFTHNVYFHREVTFTPRRDGRNRLKDETFWTVRKPEGASVLERHETNPVSTSYEWLWAEVRDSDRSDHSIRNTMRRILENYFMILGGEDPDSICVKFEGKEKVICRSLFSWVHAGSHHAFDDLYVDYDTGVEEYFNVFEKIFKKTKHEAHFNMMMRIGTSDERTADSQGAS